MTRARAQVRILQVCITLLRYLRVHAVQIGKHIHFESRRARNVSRLMDAIDDGEGARKKFRRKPHQVFV